MKAYLSVFALSLACVSPAILQAGNATSLDPACQPGTLQSYLNLSSQQIPGCSIGFLNFDAFTFFASAGSPDSASDIMLTPTMNSFAFSQTVGAFMGPAHYQIGYNFFIDPAPVLDGGDLTLDPPSGNVTITQYYCVDSTVTTGTSATGAALVTCADNTAPQLLRVTVASPFDSAVFDPPARISGGVLTDILIGPNSSFDSTIGNATVTGTPTTPEPVSSTCMLLGLGAIALRLKIKAWRAPLR